MVGCEVAMSLNSLFLCPKIHNAYGGVSHMRFVIPELESSNERWVRLRDKYLRELRECSDDELRLEIKRKLKDAFDKWLETL